jgi:uncharacterized protein (TIGR03086 family)
VAEQANEELLDQFERASAWTVTKVAGAVDHLDDMTPCDGWDVRTLLNHMLETQAYFTHAARGEEASPPSPVPRTDLLGEEPVRDFARARADMLDTFSEDGVIERTGPSLGIALGDTLLHGWDVAHATGQDDTMPDDLARAAFAKVHGAFTDDQRAGVFGPEIAIASDASAQAQLLAYTGRDPRT